MGVQEQASRERTRKNELQRLILGSIQLAGVIGIALVAPNVLGAMAKLGMVPSPRQRDVINRTSQRLIKKGLVQWQNGKLRLTERGGRQLRVLMLQESIKRPHRWDEKWRILIFDISERRKSLRLKLRNTLRSIGFQRLQDSVWVYPYDCEDLIALLKSDFHVGDDVLYIIADSIERDAVLREHFKLRARS